MSDWTISAGSTTQSPEAWGLRLVGGQFNAGSASSVRLEAGVNFDATELFAYGTAVTILRSGAPFFKGKCRAIPKHGSGSDEGQSYLIEDVWADLERTTYQEFWNFGGVPVYMPTVALGVNSSGTRINVGQQIGEVLAFAVTSGISLAAGTMPTGMLLWPSEVTGMSCAEVIRTSLRFHPDWIPWIDHSTSPPTFNVTPRAAATAQTLAVTDCTEVEVTKTSDKVPDCVRIIYLAASTVGDDVYRNGQIDKWPTAGADTGPGVLTTVVPLQGMQVQIQKQQVQTRDLPDDSSTAKAYLRLKFPAIAGLADSDFSVPAWTKSVVTDGETLPAAVNSNLPRTVGTTTAHLPRELVRGAVAEWMQKKVGKIRINFTVTASGTATVDEKALLARLPKGFTVTATNATTKIYKGVSSWTAPETAPTGVAQAYYESMQAACLYEGSATLVEEEIGTILWHGKKLNLSGSSAAGWSTMAAPIHTVSWDLDSRETTVNFGPNPNYSVQDFVEYLSLLRRREVKWYSTAERTANTLGDTDKASARGDSLGPFDLPETVVEMGSDTAIPALWIVPADAGKISVTPGTVNGEMPKLGGTALDATTAPQMTISGTKYIWLKCVGTFGSPDTWVVTVESSTTSYTPPTAPAISGTAFTSCYLLGSATAGGTGDPVTVTHTAAGGNLGVDSFGNINLWWRA